jgi:hypothetical protein
MLSWAEISGGQGYQGSFAGAFIAFGKVGGGRSVCLYQTERTQGISLGELTNACDAAGVERDWQADPLDHCDHYIFSGATSDGS